MDRNNKRRKWSCGCCKQCLLKHDCGKCLCCINKKTWKQKCILRRCSLMKKAASNPNLELPAKKWLMTMQLSYKIIEACYNLRNGDQREISHTIFDSIFISRKEDRIAIELEDSSNIIFTKTERQTHSFLDIGYSTDCWIRNRKTTDIKPSESIDNFIKTINLERVANVSSGDEDASFMSPVDYNEESETECEGNAADNIYKVGFNDNQRHQNEDVSGIPLRQNNDDYSNHESIDINQRKSLNQEEDGSDQVSIDGKQEKLLREDEVESSQDGVITRKEKTSTGNVLGCDQDNIITERRRSLRQSRVLNEEYNTENNQRKTPRLVTKSVTKNKVGNKDNTENNQRRSISRVSKGATQSMRSLRHGEVVNDEDNTENNQTRMPKNVSKGVAEKRMSLKHGGVVNDDVNNQKTPRRISKDATEKMSLRQCNVLNDEENTENNQGSTGRKRSLRQGREINDEDMTENNQRRTPRRVSKVVSYHEDNILTGKDEETDDNDVDDDDNENYLPTEEESAKEYNCPRKRRKIDTPEESNIEQHIKCKKSPGKRESGKTRKKSGDGVNMLNVYMIKAECPICQTWYKYSRTGILRHLKTNHLDIPNQFEEQFREEMRHHKPSEEGRVNCDMCKIEVDQSFAPLHIQYDHSEYMYAQSQIALAKYYELSCKSSHPLITKTAKYKFNLEFEKLTSKIETELCEYCNIPFTLPQLKKHHIKCYKNPDYNKQRYCECGYISIDYEKLILHKAMCTKNRRLSDDEGDDDNVNDDENYKTEGGEYQGNFLKPEVHEESEDLATMAKKKQVKSKQLDVKEKIKVKGRRENMLNVYMIKTKCPICESWYKYSRTGIIKHLKLNHSTDQNQVHLLTQYKEEIHHYSATENEKVMCDMCDLELDQSFAPLHIQFEHSERMYMNSQIALAKYYKIMCNSSQQLATKTAKYNFNLLFEKVTSKIKTAKIVLTQLKKHHIKCKKNTDYKKQEYCECGYRNADYDKLSQHKAICTKKRRQSNDEGDDDGDNDVVDDDDDIDKNYKPEGDESEDEYEDKFVKSDVYEKSEDLATNKHVKSEQLDVNEEINVVKARRENMLDIYMIKTKCPICKLWYKYSRTGILSHLKLMHSQVPNQGQLMTQFKEEIRHHKATENEKVICDMCDLELDQSFAPLHIQFEHCENKYDQTQMALARYYKLKCKSSQTLARETAKYKFSLLFEKVRRNIETAVCEFCGGKFSVKKMGKHHLKCEKNLESRKCYYCICRFRSVDLTTMTNHKSTCNYKPPNFLCDHCGKNCTSRSGYFKHRKFVHGIQTKRTTAVVNYQCNQCDKVYHHPSTLKTHIKSTHSKIRDYVCEICAKAYSHSNSLKRHIDFTHLNIYRHYCEKNCGYGTNKPSLLKTHVCGIVKRKKKVDKHPWWNLYQNNVASKIKTENSPAKVDKQPSAALGSSKQEPLGSYEPYSMNMDEQSDPSSGFVKTPDQSEMLYHNKQNQKEILFDNHRKETFQDTFTQQSLGMGTADHSHDNMFLAMQNPYLNTAEQRNYSVFNMHQ